MPQRLNDYPEFTQIDSAELGLNMLNGVEVNVEEVKKGKFIQWGLGNQHPLPYDFSVDDARTIR